MPEGGRGLRKKDVPQTELGGLPPRVWEELVARGETTYTEGKMEHWGGGTTTYPAGARKAGSAHAPDRVGQERATVSGWAHGMGRRGGTTYLGGRGWCTRGRKEPSS